MQRYLHLEVSHPEFNGCLKRRLPSPLAIAAVASKNEREPDWIGHLLQKPKPRFSPSRGFFTVGFGGAPRPWALAVGELEKPSNEASCASPAPEFYCKPDLLFEAEGIDSAVELLPSARGISE